MDKQDNKPKLSSFNAGAIIAIAIIADGASILLDFLYIGWLVPILFNGMVFPFWFWLAGVKYNKTDVMFVLGGCVLSFIPFLNSITLEITATQVRKVIAINGKDWIFKKLSGITNNKKLKVALKVAKVVAPEAIPVITEVEKGLKVAGVAVEVAQSSDRTPKRGVAYGERVLRTGTPMVGDRTIKNTPGLVQKNISRQRVGQEIKAGPSLSNAVKIFS